MDNGFEQSEGNFTNYIGGENNWSNNPEQEDYHCKQKGRELAKIDIIKELYKKIYRLTPTQDMIDLEARLDGLKYRIMKNICMITLNCPHGFERNLDLEDDLWDILESRSWIEKVLVNSDNFERTDREGNETHPHYHIVVKLARLYSPAQIAQMLFRIKGIKKFVSAVNYIDVRKYDQRHKKKIVDYATKLHNEEP